MLTRIVLLLATSLSLLIPAGAQYGRERPRRVNPPAENTGTPPPASPAGSSQYVVEAQVGDTLRKIAARERVPLEELVRANGVAADEELEAGREVRFYSHAPAAEAGRQDGQSPTQTQRAARARNTRGARGRSPRPAGTASRGASSSDYYTNVDGEKVRRPVFSKRAPSGATARCRDGSYSFSRHRRGTCSHHGGVAQWL